MFSSKHGSGFVDFSLDLSEASDWKAGLLTALDYHLDITALTMDPVSGLFAIGTARGVIYIYGSPGVECRLTLSDPPGLRVKFLQLAASVFKLLAVDEHERLHVWDLASFGKPKLQKLVSFPQPINCLVLSPSHSHAFLALGSGEIRTYDLLCLRTSPYVVPNLWALYESKMFSANAAATDISDSDIIVDVVIHPRDLNLLFIAYGGGVILSDLKAQNTVRAYELLLPPGAPGGNGYHHQDILTHRRPSVTTIAVHPSGHVLAVGHTDGTIAFWALEDEDRPLLLRTLDSSDSEDLSTVDATKLESTSTPAVPREPIFKLAWSSFPNSSDPRGGETVLTVLGGLAIDALPGLTALLLRR
ncbi:Uncharacterized protein C1F3.03 [Grifola frondosa]|uniref:Uncharacterized protein C1F3.03 n=1 Tax=Grifola frondosa TaxID=5627 RepID=A0A1C7MU13_GRIFR|nr:Uncharacterized protein C1F3.03 [Grifola frondosa]